jgi:hypothetical protein
VYDAEKLSRIFAIAPGAPCSGILACHSEAKQEVWASILQCIFRTIQSGRWQEEIIENFRSVYSKKSAED